ncbi:MAG: YciI family protein [Hyphomicrobiaceae bacterium]
MPRFVAVYTMKPEDVVAFRARPKSEQEAIDRAGLKAWKEWCKRNAVAIVAADVMVGKTRRVTKSGIADAHNQIAGFVIVEAADIAAAAGLFQDHPHITFFPGDGIDVMPDVTGPPED